MSTASADIRTGQPVRIMNRLCRHWEHKFPVELGEQQSTITLPLGICRMVCTDILRVDLHSDDQQMAQLQQVVADHLSRMAGSELLTIDWRQPSLKMTEGGKGTEHE